MSKLIGSIACNHAGRSRLTRRILAMMLSFAMVMSNMSVYAAEATTEAETEETTEVETETNEDADDEGGEDSAFADAFADNGSIISDYNSSGDSTSGTEYVFDADTVFSNYTAQTTLSTIYSESAIAVTDYFTFYQKSGSSRIDYDSSGKSFTDDDNTTTKYRSINTQGAATISQCAFAFTTSASATVEVWYRSGGSDDRTATILDSNGDVVATSDGNTNPAIVTLSLTDAGKYYLGGTTSIRIYYIKVTEASTSSGDTGTATDWSDIKDPVIDSAEQVKNDDDSLTTSIKVSLSDAAIDSMDTLTVNMYSADQVEDGALIDDAAATMTKTLGSSNVTVDEDDGTATASVTFTGVSTSGTYYFQAVKSRPSDTDEDGNVTTKYDDKTSELKSEEFILPLSTPTISSASFKKTESDGTGIITVAWNAVDEANYYIIALTYSDDTNSGTTIDDVTYTPSDDEADATSFETNITGLIAGSTVKVTVQAIRGTATGDDVADVDKSEVSATRTVTLETVEVEEGTYVFESKDLASLSASSDGEEIGLLTGDADNDYFVLVARSGKPGLYTPEAEYEFDDGYTTAQFMKFGGGWNSSGNWITFTTTKTYAKIKIWWQSGTASRSVGLYNTSMTELDHGDDAEAGKGYIETFTVDAAGTYRIAPSKAATASNGDIRIAKIEVTESDTSFDASTQTVTTFDTTEIYGGENAKGTWADGYTESYVDDYFTVLYTSSTQTAKSAQTWADGYSGTYRLSFNNTASTTGSAIKFTTTQDEAKVKVWWRSGGASRAMQLLNEDGTQNAKSDEVSTDSNISYISTFTLDTAGTYYLGNESGNNYIYKVEVTEGHSDVIDWSEVAAPVITGAAQDYTDDVPESTITVSVDVVISETDGADKVTVYMYDKNPSENADAEYVGSGSTSKEGDSATVSITPEASGNYWFVAKASRDSESTTLDSDVYAMTDAFILPMSTPTISRATNMGTATDDNGNVTGSIEIAYNEVDEATYYVASAIQVNRYENTRKVETEGDVYATDENGNIIYYDEDGNTVDEDGNALTAENGEPHIVTGTVYETETYYSYEAVDGAEAIKVTSEETTATLEGLTPGEYYAFTVYAVRGDETVSYNVSKTSDEFYKNVKEVTEQVWDFSAFGESTSITSTTTTQSGDKVVKNGYSGDVNDDEVTVWALGNGGKIVPASTDGVSFLYTQIKKDQNFVLEATAVVDQWTYSNGQEGFGLMVADTVGENGYNTKFWNNSYMAVVTKMEYYWNGSTILPTSVGVGDDRVRYNMYLGIGAIGRTGVTDAWADESAAGATIPSAFVSDQISLEASAGKAGLTTGSYNIIGNNTNSSTGEDIEPLLTEVKLRIEKNNSGYFVTYIDADGTETTKKYYDTANYKVVYETDENGEYVLDDDGEKIVKEITSDYENMTLLQIDKDYMYVGFFAARNAMVTYKDINFEVTDVADGGEPELQETTYNSPTYTILSATNSNSSEYEVLFSSNWQGTLSVKDAAGNELVDEDLYEYLQSQTTTYLNGGSYDEITMFDKMFTYDYETDNDGNKIIDYDTVKLMADVKAVIPILADVTNEDGTVTAGVNQDSLLTVGANTFTVTFTPDSDWHIDDSKYQVLSSYDTSVQTLTVNYRIYGEEGTNIYVSPSGKSTGDGTQDSPLDIYTAVKYVQAGQTIVMMDGTYSLKSALVIERGIDGTATNPIRMVTQNTVDRSNPWVPSSVVIDFNGIASGMTIAGDYWYLSGFDVTNSSDGNKGLQISGSHNTLDQINTYYNGNTGIQLSRYKGTDVDKADDWPSYNTIKNCTSYLNADSGYEDADGFAAKLTIGDGNVFDGCIAAYNADDGWDLFAKSETGPIGQVTIQNCVSFGNGYVLLNSSGELDIKGTNKVTAGNGNGFKMGGESIKGHHMLLNSYSFLNGAKGIDSNSCPDIQAYNCISFDNENYNIAFYTGVAKYTEYNAYNVISFRSGEAAEGSTYTADKLTSTVDDVVDTNYIDGDENWDYMTDGSNYFWSSSAGAAVNASGSKITADSFESTRFDGYNSITRNDDGTINMNGFLELTDSAKSEAGFTDLAKNTAATDPVGTVYTRYDKASDSDSADLTGSPSVGGTASDDASPADKDTSGAIEADDDDSSSSDTWTDEELAQLDTSGSTLKILLDLDYDSDGNYYVDYTGAAIKPNVRVAYGTTELSTKNYSVSFKNNTKAYELLPGDKDFSEKDAPQVIIKGKGNYSGTYTLYFTIKKIDMESDKVVSADIYTVENGKAQKITPTVTFNGKKLGTKEYSASKIYQYTEAVTDGEGTVVTESEKEEFDRVTGAGTYYIDLTGNDLNFTGTKTVTITVLSESDAANLTPMSKVKVSKIADQIYSGNANEPEFTVTYGSKSLTADSYSTNDEGNQTTVAGEYSYAYYNNTDIGVASIVLTGNIEKGYYGTKTVTFKTVAKAFNLKDYSVKITYGGTSYETNDQYKNFVINATGSPVTFGNIKVYIGSSDGGTLLTEDTDYTVSYRNNKKAGNASVVIKGIGNYSGSMTRTFKINPFTLTSSNISVTVASEVEYSKGGAKPSVVVKVDMDDDGVCEKAISSSYYTVSYKNNTKLTSQSGKPATVSITGKGMFKGSVKDKAEFSVVAKNLSTLTASADDVFYGTAKTLGDNIKYATKLYVKDGTKTLSLNSDYTVTYYNGTTISDTNKLEKNSKIEYTGENKTITAVITGGSNGLYTGTLKTTYNVVAANDIKSAKIASVTTAETYNDSTVSVPALTVTIKNKTYDKLVNGGSGNDETPLTLNTDYEITSIKNNDKVGTATVTLKGKGNYCGTKTATFKIAKKDLSDWNKYISYAVSNEIVVDVNRKDILSTGVLKNGITFDDVTLKVQTGTTTVTNKDGSTIEDMPVYETRTNASLLEAVANIYTIGNDSATTLEYGTDFTVSSYSNYVIDINDIEVDTDKDGKADVFKYDKDGYYTQTATFTIKGISPYTGSKTFSFTIRVDKNDGNTLEYTTDAAEDEEESTETETTTETTTEVTTETTTETTTEATTETTAA